MIDFNWISENEAVEIHDIQIEMFGGLPGVRSLGSLSSALARPRQLYNYSKPDIAELAAAYAFGISRNHPFVDGNKRAAYAIAATFLEDHDCRVLAASSQIVDTFIGLANGHISESVLAAWFRERVFPVSM